MTDDILSTIADYNQWSATRKAALADTSPEAYVLDREKDEAVERIEQVLTYMGQCDMLRIQPDKHRIRAMLEGTYVEQEADSGRAVGAELQPATEATGEPAAANV